MLSKWSKAQNVYATFTTSVQFTVQKGVQEEKAL